MAQPNPDDALVARSGFLAAYERVPLYLKILVGLILGVVVGYVIFRGLDSAAQDAVLKRAADPAYVAPTSYYYILAETLNKPAVIILRLLGAIAPPLILVAVIRALMTADLRGSLAGKMVFLLVLNTIVAILIGLLVANVIKPGKHEHLVPTTKTVTTGDPLNQFLDNIPKSIVGTLADNNVIGVIIIAVGVGIAARRLIAERKAAVLLAVETIFDLILVLLHWIIALVPLAVFGKVAYIIGTQGFAPFKSLAWFIFAVITALILQAIYYLTRISISSWVSPRHLLTCTRDALVMAFSTGSSTATMPVTYDRLVHRVGLREETASLGSLVGSNFNNDGTALYEAMSALFVAQMIGMDLSFSQQLMVVLTSVVASVGAAGIPEAGLVTMTLVFNAVGLPIGYIALLLPVDWFLDRCRTMINVMGDMNVSCMLEGKNRKLADAPIDDASRFPLNYERNV